MTVKDIVRLSAIYLNMENVVKYLDGGEDNDALGAVNTLTVCANIVVNELACTYIPMIKTEPVTPKKGRVYFSELTETPLEIISVKDGDNELSFSFDPEYIVVSSSAKTVSYKYLPPNYGLTDNTGYKETQVPVRVLAYGTVAEYCLTIGAFSESVMWRNRFNEAISALCLPKSVSTHARSFV
jgi:hypothetical protein